MYLQKRSLLFFLTLYILIACANSLNYFLPNERIPQALAAFMLDANLILFISNLLYD